MKRNKILEIVCDKTKLNTVVVCGGGCGNRRTSSANTGCNRPVRVADCF